MKNFSLFLLVVLMILSSCNTSAQNNKYETSASALTKAVSPAMVDLNVDEFEAEMKNENVVILDVRTPGETTQGVIEGAIEIDVRNQSFKEKIQKLDKSKTYLVYCRSGRRSVTACKIMEEEGFGGLKNLVGGYNAWSAVKK